MLKNGVRLLTTMKKSPLNLLLALSLLLATALACSDLADGTRNADKPASAPQAKDTRAPTADSPAKLDSYTIKGIKFAYFKIPAGLKKDDLIATARKLHEREPDTQLVLVDDDSQLADYIKYVKAISGQGEIDKPMPLDWADKHIIANVQKYTSGKFVLCEGYGSNEIAELK